MVVHAKLLLNDLGDQLGSPDPRVESMSHRSTFYDVVKRLPLGRCQFTGASTTVTFLDTLDSVIHPTADPVVNTAAMHVQQVGNGWRGVAVSTQENCLKTQGHAR